MELLPLHIEYLLTRHDCVIVPGIGALIASETAAEFDVVRGVVTPRRREISFNNSVVSDDGLLSHSIAQREKLTYEEAHRLLSRLTAKMAADLRNEGEASLGRIGRLVTDNEGLISFQPRKSIIDSDILTDAPLRIERNIAEENEASATKALKPATEKTKRKKTDVGLSRTIEVPYDRYVFTISRKAVHAVAMLIMAVTIGLAVLIPVNQVDEQKASVLPIDEILRRHPAIDEKHDNAEFTDTAVNNSSSKLPSMVFNELHDNR